MTCGQIKMDMKLAQKREIDALNICYVSTEHKEAVDAFLNKRKPDFRKASQNAAE